MAVFQKAIITRKDGSKEYYAGNKRVSAKEYAKTETFKERNKRKREERKAREKAEREAQNICEKNGI